MKTLFFHIAASLLLLIGSSICGAAKISAQTNPMYYDYSYNHLDWFTVESEHFLVHFQDGNDRSAQVVSRIAEEIYGPITELYEHEPDEKVSIVLKDREDYSNGAAYFFDNKIDIWVPALDAPLRGTHSWMRNVITHEFTHIIQIQVGLKRERRTPATYLQWLSYEKVRRPDVLYGFPNGIASLPFASLNIPAWLAEGTAQFQRKELSYDKWDAHRDMILRNRVLSNSHFSLPEMGTFASKTSIEIETVYNQGFAFTRYMADRFGEVVLKDITLALGQDQVFDVAEAIEIAIGIPGEQVFEEWIYSLKEEYSIVEAQINHSPWAADSAKVSAIEREGFYNFYPRIHPESGTIAYVSNRERATSRVSLYTRELNALAQEEDISNGTGVVDGTNLSLSTGSSSGANSSLGSATPIVEDLQAPAFSPAVTGHAHIHELEPQVKFINNSFDWSPSGKQLVYSVNKHNQYGEDYRDLFIHDLSHKTDFRISQSARLESPAWHPQGLGLVAVQQSKGTQNLVWSTLPDSQSWNEQLANAFEEKKPEILLDEWKNWTSFEDGRTMFSLIWHPNGQQLYGAYAYLGERQLFNLDPENGAFTPLTAANFDLRDPYVDSSGSYLYFSAAPNGRFNIYRVALNSEGLPIPNRIEQLTDVVGGAFMPIEYHDRLYYSEYIANRYTIRSRPIHAISVSEHELGFEWLMYDMSRRQDNPQLVQSSNAQLNQTNVSPIAALNYFDDSDLTTMPDIAWAYADTGSYSFDLPTIGQPYERSMRRYTDTYTQTSFFPLIRFDNYTQRNGRNGQLLKARQFGDIGQNLWRDMKPGVYMASRDVIDRLSIFGGIMVGLGSKSAGTIGEFFQPSRLTELDRDIFFQAEYRGLPFIQHSWSPTVSVEIFNLHRNVDDGLSITEFPCTSCLPDTTRVDIGYEIWQADVYFRSKLSRFSLLEIGAGYSPYRVSTDNFYSRELKAFITGSSSEYFKSTTLSAAYTFNYYQYTTNSDIAPLGFKGYLRYQYQPSKLLEEYEIKEGSLVPIFKNSRNHSTELHLRYGFRTFGQQAFQARVRGFSYFNNPKDSFYTDYVGGFLGLRSYPFFAIGGSTTAMTSLSWFLPIRKKINSQIGPYTLDKMYARLFFETGNGWYLGDSNNVPDKIYSGPSLKSGIGAELRIATSAYYLFPIKFFVSGAYGFDRFSVELPDDFVTPATGNRVNYGGELLFHFGLTFDFELL